MAYTNYGNNAKTPLTHSIPGLGTKFFIHPNHVQAGGKAGKYIPGLKLDVYVPANCVDARGGADKHIPGLGTKFFIDPVTVK